MNFFFLAAGMFALGCDDYIFAGLLPGISASFGTSIVSAAQGISIYGITYVGALPLCVFLLTKWPTRQVLLWALLIFIFGNAITFLSVNLLTYLLGRAVAGVGAGLYLPLAIAAAGELVDPSAKGKALSLAWGSNAAGAVIGIPIGLWLAEQSNWRVSVGMIVFLSVVAFLGLLSRTLDLKVSAPPSLREQAELFLHREVMSVITITILTATAGLGLYVYTTPVLEGSPTSAATALSLWNVGGLIGSVVIGYVIDWLPKPQWVMAGILTLLLATFFSIPLLRHLPFFGLLPFLLWGALGWSTMTPQQYRLSQIQPGRDAELLALNSSAVSLGAVVGSALGGVVLASGFDPRNLPYLSCALVFCAFSLQLFFLHRQECAS